MAMASLKSSGSGYSAELDEAERASRDEIMALQTKRLAWSLKHAYDNVAHYRKAFDAAGVHPSDFRQLSDLAKFPFTVKTDLRDNYPFNMFAVPREKLVRVHASSGTTGKPIVVGYTQGDIDIWSDVMARSIRAAGGRTGMLMHNAYGYGLFTGGLGAHYGAERLGCTVVPVSGGMTERQVQLINDFKPDIITVTPSYMLAILDEFKRQGLDPQQIVAEVRHLRRRALDQRDARRDRAGLRHGRDRYLRPVGSDRPRRGAGMRGDQGWPAHLGGSFLSRGDRSRDRRGAARRREGRTGVHLADQAGLSDHPLPHPRPDAAVAGHGAAGHAAHGKGHRPLRRHDHPARRQRIPDPDRGSAAGDRLVRRPFHHRTDARRADGRDDRARRSPPRKLGRQRACPRTPKRSRSSSRTPSASPRASRPSPRTRWNARSARQNVFTTSGRKGNSCCG